MDIVNGSGSLNLTQLNFTAVQPPFYPQDVVMQSTIAYVPGMDWLLALLIIIIVLLIPITVNSVFRLCLLCWEWFVQ
jgi:hypothetical protein